MKNWSDLFAAFVDAKLAGLDREAVLLRFAWVGELAGRARETLTPERLESTPPETIYAELDALNVPQCRVRMANLGRENQARDVVDGIRRLLLEPGDFQEKYRAGKVPQAGIVTLTQVLCLARPHRFAIRNAAVTRALAKQIPFYTARAVEELGYEEFLDLCRELAKTLEGRLARIGLGEWARELRFLLLYALLTE